EHEVERSRVLGDDPPRLPPRHRVVLPAQVLHDLVQPAVAHDAVLVRAGAGRPASAEVHPEEVVTRPAGGDAPVPARAIRPDAAAPVLHREAGARIETVPPLAGDDLPVAWQRGVLRVALEARR